MFVFALRVCVCVLVEARPLTDRQTDRLEDGQIDRLAVAVAATLGMRYGQSDSGVN